MIGNSPVNRPSGRGQETLFLILFLLTYHVTLDKSFPLYIPDLESGSTSTLIIHTLPCSKEPVYWHVSLNIFVGLH